MLPLSGTFTVASPAANVSPVSLRQIAVANELVVWSTSSGRVDSTIGPISISISGEIALSPSVVWLGGSRYLIAYVVENGGASRIELVTIDVNGRRRAVR